MHNRNRRDKTTPRRRARTHSPPGGGTDSVKDLLQAAAPLGRIGARAAHHQELREWLIRQLPALLAPTVRGVAVHGDTLVVLVAGASWGVRLRYAIPDFRAALERDHPGLTRITVRVVP